MTIRERIGHLLHLRWAGNQSDMATAVKCSQAALSRIVRGKQPPGKCVLKKLLAHPEICEDWLLRGEGEPLRPAGAAEGARYGPTCWVREPGKSWSLGQYLGIAIPLDGDRPEVAYRDSFGRICVISAERVYLGLRNPKEDRKPT